MGDRTLHRWTVVSVLLERAQDPEAVFTRLHAIAWTPLQPLAEGQTTPPDKRVVVGHQVAALIGSKNRLASHNESDRDLDPPSSPIVVRRAAREASSAETKTKLGSNMEGSVSQLKAA